MIKRLKHLIWHVFNSVLYLEFVDLEKVTQHSAIVKCNWPIPGYRLWVNLEDVYGLEHCKDPDAIPLLHVWQNRLTRSTNFKLEIVPPLNMSNVSDSDIHRLFEEISP